MNNTYTSDYNKAKDLYELGEYQGALHYWQQALQQDPTNNDILIHIALIKQCLGNIEGAKADYHTILQTEPNHQQALADLALIYFNQDNFEQAKVLYTQLLKLNPKASSADYYLGCIAEKEQQLSLAIDHYQTFLQYYPHHYKTLMALAALYNQFDSQQAESFYLYILQFYPKDLQVMRTLASISLQQQGYKECEVWLKRAIASDAENIDVMLDLGRFYAKFQERQVEAAYWLHKALKEDMHNLAAHLALAQFYQQSHDDKEAEFYLHELLELSPSHLPGLVQLIGLLITQERLLEAHEYLEQALQWYSKEPVLHRLAAKLYLHEANNTKAQVHLLRALSLDPNDQYSMRELAKIYVDERRVDEAEQLLKELLAIDNQNNFALNLLHDLYIDHGKVAKSKQLAKKYPDYSKL